MNEHVPQRRAYRICLVRYALVVTATATVTAAPGGGTGLVRVPVPTGTPKWLRPISGMLLVIFKGRGCESRHGVARTGA